MHNPRVVNVLEGGNHLASEPPSLGLLAHPVFHKVCEQVALGSLGHKAEIVIRLVDLE